MCGEAEVDVPVFGLSHVFTGKWFCFGYRFRNRSMEDVYWTRLLREVALQSVEDQLIDGGHTSRVSLLFHDVNVLFATVSRQLRCGR